MTLKGARILLASGNPKKLKELNALLSPLGIDLLQPEDVGGLPEVIEDLPDFKGNAAKKAISAALTANCWALADDSGLEVDHLDGAPGVFSARYAGEHGDDEANNQKLLVELKGVPSAQRGARFVCSLALARPDGTLAAEIQGTCRGTILEEMRGDRDFGYDPLFEFAEPGTSAAGKTFAELDSGAKSSVSHRGRALTELAIRLKDILATDA
ncbi:MAG: XTP/dITP diphosphohydrolase [Planctomycetota bacterium]